MMHGGANLEGNNPSGPLPSTVSVPDSSSANEEAVAPSSNIQPEPSSP